MIVRPQSMLIPLLLVSGFGFAGNIMADGAAVYNSTCIACHGADGKGVLPGAPDFTDNEGSLSKVDTVLFQNIINGFQSPGSPMAMPPKGGNASLSDQDIENVIAYMRSTFAK